MTARPAPPGASVVMPQGADKLHAPSAARNAEAIADLLSRLAPPSGRALELASGTGQHSVVFARRMPQLTWQPTEIAEDRLASIGAYVADAALPNLRAPLTLDATAEGWSRHHRADLIVLVNLLHLISEPEAETLITEAAGALAPGGMLVLYGPFRRDGALTSDGDRQFHASLVASDPTIGLKDDRAILHLLAERGLTSTIAYEMPANNLAFASRKPGPKDT